MNVRERELQENQIELEGYLRMARSCIKELEAENAALKAEVNKAHSDCIRTAYEAGIKDGMDTQRVMNKEAIGEARQQAAWECILVINNGSFLHDQSPPRLFVNELIPIIKRHFGIKDMS